MENINSNGLVKASNLELNNSFSALNNIGGGFKISDPINVGIELGRMDGTPGTPYIDFHTDGNPNTDYNVRMLAEGGCLKFSATDGLKLNEKKIISAEDIKSSGQSLSSYLSYNSGTTGINRNSDYLEFVCGDTTYVFQSGYISCNSNTTTTITFARPLSKVIGWGGNLFTLQTSNEAAFVKAISNTGLQIYQSNSGTQVCNWWVLGIKR